MPPKLDDYMKLILRGGEPHSQTPGYGKIAVPDRDYTQEDFEGQIVEKETEGRGMLFKVLNAFGAGEYAVSSFLKAWHSGDENPFAAAAKGLYSAFTDDEEYETRMTDVLTEFGWTPEDGSWERTGHSVAGFALGIALDPLTWMGFGPAARATRINSQTIASWAKAAGLPTKALKGWGKGQALNKLGTKVYQHLLKKNTAAVREAGGDMMQLVNVEQKTLWQMLNLGMPTDLIEGIAKKVGTKGERELKWSFLEKNRDLVKEVLGVMGRKADDAGIDDFIAGGYRDLLDKGGLKFMRMSMGFKKAGYLTPNSASLTGFLLGDKLTSNAPFLGRMGEKLKGTKVDRVWNELIAAPFRALHKKVNKYAGVPKHLHPWIDEVHALMGNSQQMKSAHLNALDSFADPPSAVTGKKAKESEVGQLFSKLPGMPTPQQHLNQIYKPRQQEAVGQLLMSARYHQIELDDLDEYIADIFNNAGHRAIDPTEIAALHDDMKHWGLEKWTVKEKYGIQRVAENYRAFSEKLPRWEEALEMGEQLIAPSYFAKRYRKGVGVADDPESIRKAMNGDPFFFRKEQTQFYLPTRDNVKSLAEAGSIPGIPEFNVNTVMDLRLTATYQQAYQKDFLNRLVQVAGITPGAEEVLTDLIKTKEWKGVMPEMTRLLTRLADRTTGIDAADLGNFNKFVNRLSNTQGIKQMSKLMDDFATDSTMVANLSKDHIDTLLGLWDEGIAGKVSRSKAVSIKETADKWADGAQWMENQRENLGKILNQRGLETAVAKMQKDAITSIAPEAHRALWSKATKQGLARARNIRPDGAPMTSLADIEAGNSREMMMIRAQNLLKELGPDKITRQDRFFARYADQFGKRADNLIARKDELKRQLQKLKDRKPLSMTPSKMQSRSAGLSSEIHSRIEEIVTKIEGLGQLGVSDRRRAMGMWLYGTEYETLTELLKQIPGRGFGAGAKGKHAVEAINLWRQVTARAKDLGVDEKKYMQTVIKQYGSGKTLDTMTEQELRLIKKSMDTVTEESAVAQTERILSLGVEGTEFKQLDLKRIKHLNDPIDGLPRPTQEFVFEAPVVDEIKRAWEPKDMTFAKKAFESFNSMTYAFKKWVTVGVGPLPRPAFYIRNIVDLAFRGTVGFGLRAWQVGWQHRGDVAKVLAGKEGEWTLRNGDKIPYELIRTWLAGGDAWRHGIARMPRHHADEAIRWGEKMDYVFNTEVSQRFAHSLRSAQDGFTRLLDKLHIPTIGKLEGKYSMENYATITALMSEMDAGIPVSQALKGIRESLFSFSGMTDTERYFLRSIIPFYTFSRAAVPFVGKLFTKRPWIPGTFQRATDIALPTPEEEAQIPQHIRDYPWISLSKTPKGLKVLSMRNTFTVDIANDIIPSMTVDSLRELVGQLNPLIVAPVEYMIGQQAFMQKDIKSRERIYRQMKTPFMREGPIGWWLNARDVTYKGKEYLAVDGGKWHLLRRTWFSRLFRELDEYASVLGGHGAEPLVGLLTGFKIVDLDQERQMQILGIEAEQAYRQYRHAVSTGDQVQVDRALEEYRLK